MGTTRKRKMPSRLAIALAVLTCLAWSPIDASDVDTVVPENMADNSLSAASSHLHPLVLLATSAIKTELDNMKTYPIAAAAVTPIQQMVQDLESAATDSKASNTCHAKNTADASTCSVLTTASTCNGNDKCSWASDGGTADIAAALSTAKTNINNALTTMRDALVSDYNQAKGDLNTLDAAIDNSERTIMPSELEAIKTKASNWCTARGEKTQADQAAQAANSVLSTKLNVKLSDLNVTDIKVSEIGALGEGACSKASGVAEGGNCPTSSCSLATKITTALDTANKEYLDASWDKYNKDTTKSTKQNADDNAKGNFNTIVDTTASNYHAMCSSQDTVHGAAVKMFNDNNAHRASMYRSLGVIMCHINHMETSSQSYNLSTDLVKSGGTAATTDANHCLSQLKSTDDLKTALFPAATAAEDSNKACPTLQQYFGQIKAYGSLNFEKDVWTPSETNCDAVTAHGACAFPMKQGDACAAEFSQHPTGYNCTYSRLDPGSINNCYVGSRYKVNMGTTQRHNKYIFSDAKLQECVDSCQQNYGNGSPLTHGHSNCEDYGGADIKYGGIAMMGDGKCYCYASSGTDGATVVKDEASDYLVCVEQ